MRRACGGWSVCGRMQWPAAWQVRARTRWDASSGTHRWSGRLVDEWAELERGPALVEPTRALRSDDPTLRRPLQQPPERWRLAEGRRSRCVAEHICEQWHPIAAREDGCRLPPALKLAGPTTPSPSRRRLSLSPCTTSSRAVRRSCPHASVCTRRLNPPLAPFPAARVATTRAHCPYSRSLVRP